MEEEPGMFCEPFFDCGMVVSGVVVENKMTIKSLDLALLVNAEHQRVFGGIQVQANHIMEFLNETRIAAQFERTNQVGLPPMLLPDTLYGGGTQTHGRPHAPPP